MIYVGSPYSHPQEYEMQVRYEAVLTYCAEMILKKELVYSPIVHNHWINKHLGGNGSWELWKEHDLYMLRHCTKLHVLCLDGYQISVGLNAEIQVANNMCLPIHFIDPVTHDENNDLWPC